MWKGRKTKSINFVIKIKLKDQTTIKKSLNCRQYWRGANTVSLWNQLVIEQI